MPSLPNNTLRTLAPRPMQQTEASSTTKSLVAEVYSSRQWDEMYPHIERMYIREHRPLSQVMEYLERKHQFKATAHMYKKRLGRWGLSKNSKPNRPNKVSSNHNEGSRGLPRTYDDTFKDKFISFAQQEVYRTRRTLDLVPCHDLELSNAVKVNLFHMTKIRDWTAAYFENPNQSQPNIEQFREKTQSHTQPFDAHSLDSALKLVAELLRRSYGVLAGKLTRKAFVMIEDLLELDGPAIIWNLAEILYNTLMAQQYQLFDLLVDHTGGLSKNRYINSHPLIQTLLSLRNHPEERDNTPELLRRGLIMDADIIFKNASIDHMPLYRALLWDSCTVKLHVEVLGHADKFWNLNNLIRQEMPFPWEERLKECGLLEDATAQHIKRADLNNSAVAKLVYPGQFRVDALRENNSGNENGVKISCIYAQMAALATKTMVQLDLELGAYFAAQQRMSAVIALREHAHGRSDPRVVLEMFFLNDMLTRANKN